MALASTARGGRGHGWSCRRKASQGCSPRVTSSGPPSRRWPSGMSASRVMPRPVGMPSADMRHAEMPPATAATHATNRDLTTPPGSRGPTSWLGWGRSFRSSAQGAAATSASSRYTQAGADPEGPHARVASFRVANRSSLRQSLPPVARPPTGESSARSTFDRAIFQASPDELPDIDIHSP